MLPIVRFYPTCLALPTNSCTCLGSTQATLARRALAKQPDRANMQSCASPGLFFEVSPTQGISPAMCALSPKRQSPTRTSTAKASSAKKTALIHENRSNMVFLHVFQSRYRLRCRGEAVAPNHLRLRTLPTSRRFVWFSTSCPLTQSRLEKSRDKTGPRHPAAFNPDR